MITQYRSAYNNFYKAPTFSGRSIDTKLNGDVFMLTSISAADATFSKIEDNKVTMTTYPDGETITGLVNLNGWKCEKITIGKGINLTNVVDTSMTVYITSIGEGTYR